MAVYFLDVNIPMYAAGTEHELREPCRWIMEAVVEGGISVVIDTEVIQEILYRFGALRRRATGATMAENLMAIVPVVHPVRPEDARSAIDLYRRYSDQEVPARDCLHAAVMLNRGIEAIISVDEDYDAMAEVKRIDPRALYPS